MGHDYMTYQRLDNVKDLPHICGGLNDHAIRLTQVLACPLPKLAEFDPAGRQDPFLAGAHATHKHIFLVNIQCDVSLYRSCPRIDFHATLLLVFVDWGADFWVRAAATDSGLASPAFPD